MAKEMYAVCGKCEQKNREYDMINKIQTIARSATFKY